MGDVLSGRHALRVCVVLMWCLCGVYVVFVWSLCGVADRWCTGWCCGRCSLWEACLTCLCGVNVVFVWC